MLFFIVLQTDISLSDLSYKYNFSSPSFFSDYFRRNTGCSPMEYRTKKVEYKILGFISTKHCYFFVKEVNDGL